MFKKIAAITLALLMVFGTFCMLGCGGGGEKEVTNELTVEEQIAQSEFLYPDKTEDFRYNRYTYYVKITQCLSLKSNIVIPDTIAGLPVYEIQENAFANQITITSVSIADSILTIGSKAFSGCTNLKEVKLPKTIKTIGESAFANTALKKVEFPNSLDTIPNSICSSCHNLSYVIINEPNQTENTDGSETAQPTSRTIENGAFSDCPSLKFMWVPEDVVFTDTTIVGDDNLVIYGYQKSSAATIAATSFVDFHLIQNKAELTEFKNKAELASDTITLNSNENYKGALINMQIEKTYIVREKVAYETTYLGENNQVITNSFEYTPDKGTNLIIFGIRITNNSAQKINFNQLSSTIKVDTYFNRFINLGTIKNSALAKYSSPNYTLIEPDTTGYIYFATVVDEDWEEININFGNFSELVNYNFIVKNDETLVYVGTESNIEETTEVVTLPDGTVITTPTTSTEETTNDVTNTTDITGETTTNTDTSVTESTTATTETTTTATTTTTAPAQNN